MLFAAVLSYVAPPPVTGGSEASIEQENELGPPTIYELDGGRLPLPFGPAYSR